MSKQACQNCWLVARRGIALRAPPLPAQPPHGHLQLPLALGGVEVADDLFHERDVDLHGALGLGDLGLELLGRQLLELLDGFLLLVVAEVHVVRTALRAQVLIRKLLEVLVATAALVGLQVARVAVLYRGEALNLVLLAKVLAGLRAVHVGDQGGGGALEVVHQPVPSGLHRLAVASPGRQELDEDALPGRRLVPRGARELHGTSSREQRREGENAERHGRCRRWGAHQVCQRELWMA
mmetsp:Transcript_91568/g.285406  ORF Transcript_91568/g.285406 Transcript_91568/m.285406 type:complete len:238 (-) Transcript_91568:37-750(-)